MPPQVISLITGLAHATFMSGMRAAFVVAAFAALVRPWPGGLDLAEGFLHARTAGRARQMHR